MASVVESVGIGCVNGVGVGNGAGMGEAVGIGCVNGVGVGNGVGMGEAVGNRVSAKRRGFSRRVRALVGVAVSVRIV